MERGAAQKRRPMNSGGKMNIKLKLMLLCAAVPAMLCNTGFAQNVDSVAIDDASGKIIISGTPDGIKKGDFIAFELLKKDMKSADIKAEYTPGELIGDFIAVRQLRADKNGGYTISADMNGRESGFYMVRINGADNEIYFATEENRRVIVKRIADACRLDEAAAVAELARIYDLSNDRGETVNSFNITDKLVFAADETELFKVLRSVINDTAEEKLSVANVKEKTSAAAALCALDAGEADIEDVKDILNLEEASYKVYNGKLSDTAKAGFVVNYFAGRGISTRTKANEHFKNVITDALCADIRNWADAEDIINEYGVKFGINVTKLNSDSYGVSNRSKVYSAAADVGKFESAKAFADFVNSKIIEYAPKTADTRPSGGGAGRGGYTGGGAGGTSVTPPVVTKENKEEDDAITPAPSFDDLEGYDWAAAGIEELYRRGVVKGLGDGTFNPGGNVTREEMLAMLLRAFNIAESENPSQEESFTDAEPDAWYIGYIAAGKKKGFVKGYPDGSFGIGESVSRQDAAVMAYNIAKASGKELSVEIKRDFKDDNGIADYAKDAVYSLKANGVVSGTGSGNFEPLNTCTRAEAAKIIYSLMTSGKELSK